MLQNHQVTVPRSDDLSGCVLAVDSIMSIRWVTDMRVVADNYCTAQGASLYIESGFCLIFNCYSLGAIKQFADVSSAIWTLVSTQA
jgi:hypothetical protein